MLCCLPSPIGDDVTPQETKLLRILKILIIGQLVRVRQILGILTCIVDTWEGILMLIGASILWCVTCGKNWCTCVIYILLCIMDGLMCIIAVGSYFTDNSHLESTYGVILFITMLKLPFYLVSVYYTFLTYRELKALFIDAMNNPQPEQVSGFMQGMGFPSQGGYGGQGYPQGYQQGYQPPPPPQQPPAYQPFAGPGYRVG